jgi:hypothetical protein
MVKYENAADRNYVKVMKQLRRMGSYGMDARRSVRGA